MKHLKYKLAAQHESVSASEFNDEPEGAGVQGHAKKRRHSKLTMDLASVSPLSKGKYSI